VRAIVLVGGFGTRLRPLTYTAPKPMLPVVHRSIIEHLVGNLVRGGVTEVTLALGFKPEPFFEAFPDGTCAGAQLRYAVEPEPLDTAGAIRFAAIEAGIDDTFIVGNGDIITDLDVAQMVAAHRRSRAQASLHVIPVDDPSAFGVVDIDQRGAVRRFVEKPPPGTAPSNLINAGTYVLEPSVIDLIPSGRKVSIERETFPLVVDGGGLFAHATDDYWIDTGTPELYRSANLDAVRLGIGVARHPNAEVDPSALVTDSVVGDGCVVGVGAVVSGSVLLPGATVGAGAKVQQSLVMGAVGANATVVDVVLGADGSVESGEHLVGDRRPSV
jgi:mannose-1-phosphate guanylyltransferase